MSNHNPFLSGVGNNNRNTGISRSKNIKVNKFRSRIIPEQFYFREYRQSDQNKSVRLKYLPEQSKSKWTNTNHQLFPKFLKCK